MTRLAYITLAVLKLLLLCASAQAEWFHYAPAKSVNGQGIYQETISRCPPYGWAQIKDADKATQCHESTHFINHDISRMYKHDYCAFYTGDGKCFAIQQPPNVRVGDVAQYVPAENRTSRFRTYLSGDRVTRNCLSLVDEWTCYANDAQCTIEMGLQDDGGLKFANEFSGFVDVLIHAVKQHDPGYAQMAQLVEFVEWQKRRVAALSQSRQVAQHGWECGSLAELPTVFHQRNRDGSCVHHSTSHILHYMGLHEWANWWITTYRGGESPGPHRHKLARSGLQYVMTTDGDEQFLEWCIANRYMMGVDTKPWHCLNFLGRVEQNGRYYAVLLDNNRPGKLEYEAWESWLPKYKRCWAFTIVSGEVPPPTPTGVIPLFATR